MSNWGIVALENIANEMKNIREILEKQYRAEGEWINQEQGAFYPVECSNCHKQPLLNEDEDYEYTKYCPYCGAKMLVKDMNIPNKEGVEE